MLDLDVIAGLLLVALTAAALLWLWGLVRGHARSRWVVAGRVACAIVAAVALVGALAYRVMDSRTFQVAGRIVARVQTDQRVVALTFDDGPSSAYVTQVLEALGRHRAPGTFFVVGSTARADPAALRALVAAGQEIGNHSYTHRRLIAVSVDTVAAEVRRTDEVIRAGGFAGPILYRPPYCKKLVSAPYYLWRHGRTTVTWDLEPDSIAAIAEDPRAMTDYVTANVRPGSIILLHVWPASRDASRRALPMILAALARRGYRFVTVSRLLALPRAPAG